MANVFMRAEDAIARVPSGSRVFVHGGAATPQILLRELTHQASRFRNLELMHLHTEGSVEYAEPRYADNFTVINLFVGHNMRKNLDYGRVDYLPCFLSEIPNLFRNHRKPDVALIHVSPPDRRGYCSLGVSVDVAKAAVECADVVIAQVNPRMPRLHGDGWVHVSEIDALVEVDTPLPTVSYSESRSEEQDIARHVAGLIDDGSTLQMGIGTIPDAVARCLRDRRHLGIHTEMWSDGTLALLEAGAVDNSQKKVHAGKCVSGFLLGSQRLYDFVHDNPAVLQLGIDYVNNPIVIARNPKVVAINSAVEIDLTGQICADSVGQRIISGVGGQMDFMRGAALSEGGKPIIAVSSLTHKGESKIVNILKPGAGVVTTRAHAHFVVTEFGVADLRGKTLGERSRALIAIAHPRHQETLTRSFHETRN